MRLLTTMVLWRAGFFIVASAAPAISQASSSLEQDYATLCANKPGPETETCAALKKALVAKLNSATSSATKPSGGQSVAAPMGALTQEEIRRRWGLYANIEGKKYYSTSPAGRTISTYRWVVPGEEMATTTVEANKAGEPVGKEYRGTMRWDAMKGGIVSAGFPRIHAQPDGSLIWLEADGRQRSRHFLNGDGSWTSVGEKLKGGVWKRIAYGHMLHSEMTPQFVAQLRGGSGGGGSGFMDALGMGLGAAILTGNVETAVGAAAQTASGANAYEVMSGMADQAQADAAASKAELDRTIALAEQSGASGAPVTSGSTTGRDVLASTSSAADTNALASAAPAMVTRYYDCYGQIWGSSNGSRVLQTAFYGLITSQEPKPEFPATDAATALFRQQTASDQGSDTENPGGWCKAYDSRAEAESSRQRRMQRDSSLPARRVTLELTM